MIAEFLKSVKIFRGVKPEGLEKIAERMKSRHFRKNSLIIFEDDEGLLFFVIRKGKVKISRISQQGEEVILAILGAGEYFGEVAIIDGLPRSATVTSLDDVELLTINRDDFLRCLQDYPQMYMELLKEFAKRLRKSDAQIQSLSLFNARGRVASTLYNLALDLGTTKDGAYMIEELPLQRDLANIAGTSRETVSRVLSKFEEEGVITRSGNSITIPVLRKLEQIINEEN